MGKNKKWYNKNGLHLCDHKDAATGKRCDRVVHGFKKGMKKAYCGYHTGG